MINPLKTLAYAATFAFGLAMCADGDTPAPGSESPTQYTCRTGDRLQLRIAEDPVRGPSPMVVTVNSVGEASFPVCRNSDIRVTITVRGKTLAEVKSELSRRFLADYYNKATIDLSLADKVLTPGKVQFFGEISASIPLQPDSPPLMLSDAILQLRPSEYVDLRRIKVHRLDPLTQRSRIIEINVKDIIKNGKRDLDIILQEGDRVEVPQKWLN